MNFHRLRLINKNQNGFTGLEMVVTIFIAGIIAAASIMATLQVIRGSSQSKNNVTAVTHVQSVGFWLSRDIQMSQYDPDLGASDGFPLTLTWIDYGLSGDIHDVVYTVDGSDLKRGYSINNNPVNEITIAQFIDSISSQFADGLLTLTVTTTAGAGSVQQVSETRVYEVLQRPGS
jgi:type II secretory pathway pseudopilin PulG